METFRNTVDFLYPPPVYVNIHSNQQLAEYVTGLSFDKRQKIKELYIEYMNYKELHICINSVNDYKGPGQMLRHLKDLKTFEIFQKLYGFQDFRII